MRTLNFTAQNNTGSVTGVALKGGNCLGSSAITATFCFPLQPCSCVSAHPKEQSREQIGSLQQVERISKNLSPFAERRAVLLEGATPATVPVESHLRIQASSLTPKIFHLTSKLKEIYSSESSNLKAS